MNKTFDLVIRGGTLADGLGSELREADIGIRDGRIAEIGHLAGSGTEEIDARGRLVTPGFVDIHTHYDGQATWASRMQPSSLHGVTTAVMGNCGVGFAPVRTHDHDRLIELMEGVEDIPGAALHEGLSWQWESFPDYLNFLAAIPRDIDVAAQLPHGALRVYVMGERAARLEDATLTDIAQMRELARDAMLAGAVGFSTSRSMNHRSVKGDPTPSLKASEDELTGIAAGLADAGRGVIQVISDMAARQGDELGMVFRIARASGRPTSISLAQSHRKPDDWRAVLARIRVEAQTGTRIAAQVAPRSVGVLFGLQANRSPIHGSATFQALRALEPAAMVAAMRNPETRRTILAEAQANPFLRIDLKPYDYERVFSLGSPPDYEPPIERSVEHLARASGRSTLETAYDLMLENDGQALLLAPFANYAECTLDPCAEQLTHPDALFGLGDGGAHVGSICDASFTTYLLAHWGRNRANGRLPIPLLVNLLTARNARAVGMTDRGALTVGLKADVNIIDMARLGIHSPVIVKDLPAGGRRFQQTSQGYDATIVSGEIVYRDGQASGKLPGRLVRAAS
jgi:N-acyl-D-aspartate/D-glutamate deacylase